LWPQDASVEVTDGEHWTARGVGVTWRRQWSPFIETSFSAGRSETTLGTNERAPLVGLADGRVVALVKMPAFTEKVLSEQDLTDIYAYLKAFAAAKAAKDIPLLDQLRDR